MSIFQISNYYAIMGSCSLFAVTNLTGFEDSPKISKYCNKVGTANCKRDLNYVP